MDVELRTERFRELKPAEAFAQAAKDGTIKEGLQKMEPCAEKEQCQSAAEGEPLYVNIKYVTDPPPVLLKVVPKATAPEVAAAGGKPKAAAMKPLRKMVIEDEEPDADLGVEVDENRLQPDTVSLCGYNVEASVLEAFERTNQWLLEFTVETRSKAEAIQSERGETAAAGVGPVVKKSKRKCTKKLARSKQAATAELERLATLKAKEKEAQERHSEEKKRLKLEAKAASANKDAKEESKSNESKPDEPKPVAPKFDVEATAELAKLALQAAQAKARAQAVAKDEARKLRAAERHTQWAAKSKSISNVDKQIVEATREVQVQEAKRAAKAMEATAPQSSRPGRSKTTMHQVCLMDCPCMCTHHVHAHVHVTCTCDSG
jgi:hypothetical protein